MSLFDFEDAKPEIPKSKKAFESIEFEGVEILFFEGNTKESLKSIAPNLEMNKEIFYHTNGAWSSHHVLAHILEVTGPADVKICTWAISENPTRKILQLKNIGFIKTFELIVDTRIHKNSPTTLQLLQSVADNIVFTNVHAKLTIIKNKDWSVVHLSSANYTSNPRLETGTIICSYKVSQLYLKMFHNIQKGNEFKRKTIK